MKKPGTKAGFLVRSLFAYLFEHDWFIPLQSGGSKSSALPPCNQR